MGVPELVLLTWYSSYSWPSGKYGNLSINVPRYVPQFINVRKVKFHKKLLHKLSHFSIAKRPLEFPIELTQSWNWTFLSCSWFKTFLLTQALYLNRPFQIILTQGKQWRKKFLLNSQIIWYFNARNYLFNCRLFATQNQKVFNIIRSSLERIRVKLWKISAKNRSFIKDPLWPCHV